MAVTLIAAYGSPLSAQGFLAMKCPECQTDNRDNQKFCHTCGRRLPRSCPQCGAVVLGGHRFCGQCGLELKEEKQLVGEPKKIGERKHITAMFADLSGYTALAERLDPEEVKDLTGHFFREVAQVVSRYEGFIEKFAGDAIMALFGVPASHEDDPVRAIRAAQEIHRLVKALGLRFREKIPEPLAVHIGINTGLVVTGEILHEDGIHHVAGDTINVASRLCDLAQEGETLVGHATYEQTAGFFSFERLLPVTVKGKNQPLQVYRLLSTREAPIKTHRLLGLRAVFVGRQAEMAVLKDAVGNLLQGRGSVIAICGEAGAGKSRLIEEFKASLEPAAIHWYDGFAYAYSQNIPYYPFINLFNRIFRLEEGDSPERATEKVTGLLNTCPGDGEEMPLYLGGLLAIPGFEAGNSNPEAWKTQMHRACLTLLEALGRQSPTIFNLEDLHWADPSSLELLRFLLARMTVPALFICAYRPSLTLLPKEERAHRREFFHEVRLRDLPPPETQLMVESLLGVAAAPPLFQQLIHEQVGGNPFYIEEVINSLIEAKILVRQNGDWLFSGARQEVMVPATIHGVITARLDLLDPAAKEILQEAAVIGRTFYQEILENITFEEGPLEQWLTHLQELDLIRVKATHPEVEYSFKHVLVQEAVYNGILKKHRRDIHERIGLALERFYAERSMEAWERLAFHFKRGRSLLKAVDYLVKSGEKSVKRYALEEAYQYFLDAYELMSRTKAGSPEEDVLLVDLLMKWCLVFYYQGRFEGMAEMLLEHVKLADSLNDRAKTGEYYTWLGHATYWQGARLEDSYRYLQQALALGEETGNLQVIASACSFLIKTCAELGYLQEALLYEKRTRELLPRFQADIFLHITYFSGKGYLGWFLGEQQMLSDSALGLLEYGRRVASWRCEMVGDMLLGFWHFLNQDLEAAIALYQKVISQGDPYHAMFSRLLLGMCLARKCDFAQAAEVLTEVIDYGGKERTEYLKTIASLFWGAALAGQGELGRGLGLAQGANQAFAAYQRVMFNCLSEGLLGAIYLQIYRGGGKKKLSFLLKNTGFLVRNIWGVRKLAEEHLTKARQLADHTGAQGFLGLPCLLLGQLYKLTGKQAQARECLEEAVRVFAACDLKMHLEQARELLASLT